MTDLPTPRSRAFTFTINNYTDNDLDMLLDAEFRYMCFGFEICPETLTPHIQGYIYLHSLKTMKWVSKNIMPRARLVFSKGTSEENRKYTSKLTSKETADDWYEFGDAPTQGQATWQKIVDVMDDPKSNPHLYNQYYKTYRLITRTEKKDHERTLFFIHEGEMLVYAKNGNETVSIYPSEYDGEDVIIAPPYAFPHSQIVNWLNGLPPKYKHGYEILIWDPKTVILTYSCDEERSYIIKHYSDFLDYKYSN